MKNRIKSTEKEKLAGMANTDDSSKGHSEPKVGKGITPGYG